MFTRASRPGLACRSRALYWSSVASKLSRHSRSDSGVIGLKESVLSGSYVHQNPTGGSRWIVQSQATEDTKDSPQSHRRQPVDRSVPSFVSRYWTLGLGLKDAREAVYRPGKWVTDVRGHR